MRLFLRRGINCNSTLIHYPQTPTREGICSWLINGSRNKAQRLPTFMSSLPLSNPYLERRWAEQHVIIHNLRRAAQLWSTACFCEVVWGVLGLLVSCVGLSPPNCRLTALRSSNHPLCFVCGVGHYSLQQNIHSRLPSSEKQFWAFADVL